MNPSPNPVLEPRRTGDATLPATRPFYWSVRRELWENRSIHRAPVGVAAFVVAALVIHGATMPTHLRAMLGPGTGKPGSAPIIYSYPATLLLGTAFVIGAFYCLEALNGERRDRSILFWKSLPVSDFTAVLAKASIPLVVLPLVTLGVIIAMQLAMLLLSSAALLIQGGSGVWLWRELHPFRMWLGLSYTVVAMALWHAPLYGFLLLVSGWARRTAALWAVLPPLALAVLENLTFGTWRVAGLVVHQLVGWYGRGFQAQPRTGVPYDPLASMTPGRFLATPGLWVGLVLAAGFFAAAVHLRRYHEPG